MRDLLSEYFDGTLSRRAFFHRLVATGFTVGAAREIVEAANLGAVAQGGSDRSHAVSGTGGDLLVEQIKAAGTKYIFTNPGSYEVGFFDALTDRPELQLIMGLHEGVVITMADGYHKVTLEPAFVNLHAIAGTAQGLGQLYNAHRDGAALVVSAGLRDASVYSDDVQLAPRPGFTQAEINRQFTKIASEVRNPVSIPLMTRRAFKTAAAAPGGPVYVAYASTALEAAGQTGEIWPRDSFMIQTQPRPAVHQVERLARMLVEAERPMVMFGDEIWKSGSQDEAVELCELLGLPAATGSYASQAYQNFPSAHPQYVGGVGVMTGYRDNRAYPTGSADLVVQFGTRDMGDLNIPERPRLSPDARLVAVGLDTANLGRTQPLALAIVADAGATCRDLIEAVRSLATSDRLRRIRDARLAIIQPAVAEATAVRLSEARTHFEADPIHPDRLAYEIEQAADRDAIVLHENLTGSDAFMRYGHRPDEKWRLETTGGGLGWGIGAAIGAKLGAPNRQVILNIGDGSVMYSAPGFWTMVRYGVPLLTVVWNNYNYQTVRNAFHSYGRRMRETGHYHGMYLGDPEIDFAQLAQSQGVRGERVTSPRDIQAALRRGIQATRDGNPYLVEVVVARTRGGAESTWHHEFNLAATRTRNV